MFLVSKLEATKITKAIGPFNTCTTHSTILFN